MVTFIKLYAHLATLETDPLSLLTPPTYNKLLKSKNEWEGVSETNETMIETDAGTGFEPVTSGL
jgi:hypothetical protein